jgi:glycosyltransferase involved in cell wall biosynthesis
MRVAFVGNIYSKCGIATYNEQLFNALSKHCDVHFFAEHISDQKYTNVTQCWKREEFPKLSLIDAVDAYKPDIVLFSHEYGIFPKAYFFSSLVSYFKLKNYKVVTIFHSVYEFHKDKLTTESVCKNVVVHTQQAKDALVRKGLNQENLHIVPHGCSFGDESGKILPNLWNHLGNNHVILQAGFLFSYKNHLEMLDIVSELRKKYSDILYLIIASENPKCSLEHENVYKSICSKIETLGLQHNVIIDRGFVSNDVLMSYIRTSTVFVLPYRPSPEFDVFAASGMARIVLQTSTPLLVSKANLFHGMESVTPRLDSQEEWIDSISKVFEKRHDKSFLSNRKSFIEQNSWDNAAKRLTFIFENSK